MNGPRRRPGGATHPWTLCRPALVAIENGDPVATEALNAAAQRVWAGLGQRQKRLFHEYTCEDRTTDTHRINVSLIRSAIVKQLGEDQRRHADTARKVLDFMDEAGVQTINPQPGQKVKVICTRVADTMKLGDDPYPALAARRQITTCSGCGHNVFIDPASFGAADPEAVCTRCFDPRIGAEMDRIIEDAQRRAGGEQ